MAENNEVNKDSLHVSSLCLLRTGLATSLKEDFAAKQSSLQKSMNESGREHSHPPFLPYFGGTGTSLAAAVLEEDCCPKTSMYELPQKRSL